MAKRGTRPIPPVKQAQAEYTAHYDTVEVGVSKRGEQYLAGGRPAIDRIVAEHFKKLGIPLPPPRKR
jgi:hypothetical protein